MTDTTTPVPTNVAAATVLHQQREDLIYLLDQYDNLIHGLSTERSVMSAVLASVDEALHGIFDTAARPPRPLSEHSPTADAEDRTYLDLIGTRERLCRAEMHVGDYRQDISHALRLIDAVGSRVFPTRWPDLDATDADPGPDPADLPSADDLPAVDPPAVVAHIAAARAAATKTEPEPAVGVSKAWGWNYAAVAQAVRDAVDAGTGDAVDRVMALRPGCNRNAASQAIVKARKLGHHVPSLRTPPSSPAADDPPAPETDATLPTIGCFPPVDEPVAATGEGPVAMPAERGKLIARDDCDWATGPSHVRDLIKHTLAVHGRRPYDAERRPIKAADA